MAQITIMPPLTTELFVAAFFAMLEVCLQKCVPPYNSQTPPHTLCKPQNPSCTILVSGFSEKDKKEVLQAHNDKRSMVAQGRLPGFAPAANMYELEWADDLAEVAQAFCDLCDDSRHDRPDERKTTKFSKVGQNLAYNYDSADRRQVIDSNGRVQDWFDEYKSFPPSLVKKYGSSGGVTTHFTQVIWAETRYVGCGFTYYKLSSGGHASLPFRALFTCNYATAGNFYDLPVYIEGTTCTSCPAGTTCNATTGLCSSGAKAGPSGSSNQPSGGSSGGSSGGPSKPKDPSDSDNKEGGGYGWVIAVVVGAAVTFFLIAVGLWMIKPPPSVEVMEE